MFCFVYKSLCFEALYGDAHSHASLSLDSMTKVCIHSYHDLNDEVTDEEDDECDAHGNDHGDK